MRCLLLLVLVVLEEMEKTWQLLASDLVALNERNEECEEVIFPVLIDGAQLYAFYHVFSNKDVVVDKQVLDKRL